MRLPLFSRCSRSISCLVFVFAVALSTSADEPSGHNHKSTNPEFDVRSVANGRWSDPETWHPQRLPARGDRVLVSRGTRVVYDAVSDDVIRSLDVAGMLTFAAERSTVLNVGYIKIGATAGHGHMPGVEDVDKSGDPEPGAAAALEVGTPAVPVRAPHTARIRLHYVEGMDKDDAPAIVVRPGGRMDLHGQPMSRTWIKLGANATAGDDTITLDEAVEGWRVGDEVIVTASVGQRTGPGSTYRRDARRSTRPETEERTITKIEGAAMTLDRPLEFEHFGDGEFRSEVANLTRTVIVESADPDGVRGHTMYHWGGSGSISYARFAHLGKDRTLGRYPIHFHLVEDTMRGSSVVGAAIVDSHNRWITIHGTQYMVVRDCVGYQSVGHGYFLEDGTEVDNVLDRNLAVQAYHGRTMTDQALPFDPNDGAGFWWANGRNTLTRNVSCENDEYGYRYDMQSTSQFDCRLPIRQADGTLAKTDVRTIPIWRFEENEAHTEGFYGMVVAANGDRQPDTPIRNERILEQIRSVDWTGPDTRHPHVIRNLTIWGAHYGFRPHSPSMLIENLRIDRVTYGVYRPAFENHVYRNLHLSRAGSEPFNRGMDDASAQVGSITVDGLLFEDLDWAGQVHPLVHMSDNNLGETAECHFRNVEWRNVDPRRPVFNRGGSTRSDPFVDRGVPYYIHDHFGPGRHAKIVSTRAVDLLADGLSYRAEPPLTGDESVVTEVRVLEFPDLLDPVDDLPPATVITSLRTEKGKVQVRGISHDNGEITSVTANGQPAELAAAVAGVVDWEILLDAPADGEIIAFARDRAGNVEQTPHRRTLAGTDRKRKRVPATAPARQR